MTPVHAFFRGMRMAFL